MLYIFHDNVHVILFRYILFQKSIKKILFLLFYFFLFDGISISHHWFKYWSKDKEKWSSLKNNAIRNSQWKPVRISQQFSTMFKNNQWWRPIDKMSDSMSTWIVVESWRPHKTKWVKENDEKIPFYGGINSSRQPRQRFIYQHLSTDPAFLFWIRNAWNGRHRCISSSTSFDGLSNWR